VLEKENSYASLETRLKTGTKGSTPQREVRRRAGVRRQQIEKKAWPEASKH